MGQWWREATVKNVTWRLSCAFARRHVGDSKASWKKVRLAGHQTKRHIWHAHHQKCTISTEQGSVMDRGWISGALGCQTPPKTSGHAAWDCQTKLTTRASQRGRHGQENSSGQMCKTELSIASVIFGESCLLMSPTENISSEFKAILNGCQSAILFCTGTPLADCIC